MKLLNHTTRYFSVALLAIVGIWAFVFYINMLDEVYDSLDDGLDNYKQLIIQKAKNDSTVLFKTEFEEGNYSIRELPRATALNIRDNFRDTLMYMINEEDYEPVRILTTAFERQGKFYQLNIISSMVEEDDLISDLLSAIIILYLAMLLSILILNNILLKRIWKPFYHLIDQLKGFRLGKDTSVDVVPTRVEEFRLLNGTVESLIHRTLETYRSQREFIENASHELQTPIAISINRLELLAEKGVSEPAMNEIGTVIETLQRLSRLNQSLLLLSRIENRQFEDSVSVDLNKIVQTIADDFKSFAQFKNVQITVQEKHKFERNMNKDLAQILIANLVKNAIIHNVDDGIVEVIIDRRQISISNTGIARALDGEKIFKRFHKESNERQTTGLGLAIVKAIANLYGLTVAYSYDGKHTIRIIQ